MFATITDMINNDIKMVNVSLEDLKDYNKCIVGCESG